MENDLQSEGTMSNLYIREVLEVRRKNQDHDVNVTYHETVEPYENVGNMSNEPSLNGDVWVGYKVMSLQLCIELDGELYVWEEWRL